MTITIATTVIHTQLDEGGTVGGTETGIVVGTVEGTVVVGTVVVGTVVVVGNFSSIPTIGSFGIV